MFILKCSILLYCFFCAKLTFAKIELIQSDFGIEKCNSEKVEALDEKFYEKDCGGENLLPSVEWLDKNSSTKSYAITITSRNHLNTIMVHFIAWNVPAYINLINHSTKFEEINAITGLNSYNKKIYEGPCSNSIQNNEPSECMKFTLYALKNEFIELSEDADYYELMAYLKKMSRTEKIVVDSLSLSSLFIPKRRVSN
ncbi:phosphatidylethanolamine-binding protein [Plasmodium brasilianum]|uniref:Phosphatidylethanolamine-binding protein, putative n=2 Tax=Plasmodium (Plasmodium) TaxID=418103 RepID=A0A1D3PB32_PLAMA|nr:phosphatidylethanolamine-binding protein, putative [Plasmodium malariae]KAI4839040.1 phosphatidylethanolamine-binding protein [Plasmodium brasilianum]SCN12393.1 phosphatidylethanolamine-binding protein, putative [Plasmodium malariae]